MEFWTLIVDQLTWKDVADMAIVSILVYQVLLIIHGTRAVQMLMGIGFLLVLFWVGISYKLYSLNWMLNHFFDSFLIIGIVLFQEEIRSALASVGTGRGMKGFFSRQKLNRPIEEVVDACSALSRERIGALIVFERNHGLLNYIETGSQVNGELHSDLIYAIFESSSPLHDGAIIIRDGILAAAGCYLPLSKNIEIDRHLGTRHRAALGMSELTDAIVITVSEENGRINIIYEGEFYFCRGHNELRLYLLHLWDGEDLKKGMRPIKKKEGI